MKQKTNRREFMKKGFHLCAGCAFVLGGCRSKSDETAETDANAVDIDKLTFCGYNCEGCDFLKATQENNFDLKKDVYIRWKWKERLDVDFDPDVVFCWGCKPPMGKPINMFQERCSVRVCSVEKGKKNCVLCDELVACEKELWDRFPDHKKAVIEMQKKVQSKMRT